MTTKQITAMTMLAINPTKTETKTLSKNDTFDGGFEFLPIEAHLECGPLPTHPTSDDFQLASMTADHSPARRWHCEAIRYRRQNPGAVLDESALKIIAAAVAKNLYRIAMETI